MKCFKNRFVHEVVGFYHIFSHLLHGNLFKIKVTKAIPYIHFFLEA